MPTSLTSAIPRPLLALLAAAAVLGVVWSIVTPPLEAPDEGAHFGYVQNLAERGALPGDRKRPAFSTEQITAGSESNADQAAAQPATKMQWSRLLYTRWRAAEARLPADARSDGGGPNPASSNPPLYYLYEAPAYLIAEHADFFSRLQLMRLASMLWLLVTVTAVWLLAGEVLGRQPLLQLAAAGVAGLAPMVQFVSTTVTPDSMLFALWSIATWLGVRSLKRGVTPTRAGVMLAVVGTACVVKATAYALLPGVLFVVAAGLWRRRSNGPRVAATLAASAGGLAVTAGAWFAVATVSSRPVAAQVSDAAGARQLFNLRQAASYLWQFYMPKLPFQAKFPSDAPTIGVYDIWVKGTWGSFGWLEVEFSDALYLVLSVVTVVVIGLAIRSLWRYRAGSDVLVGGFLALVAVALLAGLHWTDYKLIIGAGTPFVQGRYLLPLIGTAGLVVAQGLRPFGARGRALGVALVVGGLFALDVASLGITLERFYA